MKNFVVSIKRFLKEGWHKFEVTNKPKTFLKYFLHYPLNWGTTLGCLAFILLFIEGAIRYESPLLWTAVLFPVIILAYNTIDGYFAFQYFKLPEYLKPNPDGIDAGELDEKFRGTDAYWDRIHKFEREHNIPLTERHNGVVGRKVSAKALQSYAKWSATAVLLYMIVRTFIGA